MHKRLGIAGIGMEVIGLAGQEIWPDQLWLWWIVLVGGVVVIGAAMLPKRLAPWLSENPAKAPRIDFVRANPDTVFQSRPAISSSSLAVSNTASQSVSFTPGKMNKPAGMGMFQRPEFINKGGCALLRPTVRVEVADGAGSIFAVKRQVPCGHNAMPDEWRVNDPWTFDLVQRLQDERDAYMWDRAAGARVGPPLQPGQYIATVTVSGDNEPGSPVHQFDLTIPETGMPTISRRVPRKGGSLS